MSKRVAVVTGGIGGLGTPMCRTLHDQGRSVAAAYYPAEEDKAIEWRKQQLSDGYDIAIYPVDIGDYDSCAALVEKIENDLGAIDILVNNAGITRDAPLKKMEKSNWDAVIQTNLTGAFNMAKQVFDKMAQNGWGRVINIASVNGQKGQFGQTNYSAAKAGLHGFTKALAQEGARKGVTVNTISPGYVGTEMVMAIPEKVRDQIVAGIPIGRLAKPEEIARAVGFLADDEAGYITGADFSINGGIYMH